MDEGERAAVLGALLADVEQQQRALRLLALRAHRTEQRVHLLLSDGAARYRQSVTDADQRLRDESAGRPSWVPDGVSAVLVESTPMDVRDWDREWPSNWCERCGSEGDEGAPLVERMHPDGRMVIKAHEECATAAGYTEPVP